MDLFTHAPKPNLRIPPILLAQKTSTTNNPTTTTTTTTNEPSPITKDSTHIATLSKQKLSREASVPDPNLRRCVGHHRLLRRSLQEAQADMRRYLDEVLESDSDDEINDDEDDHHNEDGVPVVQEKEAFLPVPGIGGNGNGSGCVREKIVGVVKGLVSGRRTRRALSFPPASFTPPILPAPPITETKTRSNSNSNSNTKSPLTNLALKNNSCTDIPIPIHIHVHEHIGKEKSVLGLETGLERSQSSPPTYTQTKSISLRGRRYAERLGFRRRCSPVGVAAGVSS